METTNDSRTALPWMPPSGRSAQLQPAGKSWDAVRVPHLLGKRALESLGEATGAVIENPYDEVLYWLTIPGTADQYDINWPPGVEVWGATAFIEVPPVDCRKGPGVRWRVPPRDRHLTEPTVLLAALKIATSAALGPREEAVR